MAVRRTIPINLRKRVLERDDYRCVKCGKFHHLELHHIFAVVYGGEDLESNLITLCSSCHKSAPDDPIEFFKWASSHLPVDLDMAKQLSKAILTMVRYKTDFKSLFNSEKKEDFKLLLEIIDLYFKDFWGVFVSGEMQSFGKFMAKYELDKEIDTNNDNISNNITREDVK